MESDHTAVVHEHVAPDLHQGDFTASGPVDPRREGSFALLQRNRLCGRRGAEGTDDHIPGASYVDLYDKVEVIPFDKLTRFFNRHLAA